MKHVTLIGSGMAAVSAAIECLEQGHQVRLISGHPGATALSSGAWDLLGPLNRNRSRPWKELSSLQKDWENFHYEAPFHPYGLLHDLLRQKNGSLDRIQTQFQKIASRLKNPVQTGGHQHLLALTPAGTLKSTYALPDSQCANIHQFKQAHVLIIGFRGLPQFNAAGIARVLEHQNTIKGSGEISQISCAEIDLMKWGVFENPITSAMAFDTHEALCDFFVEEACRIAREKNASHVALPPILGIKKNPQLMKQLKDRLDLAWFETLATPPSVPGLRLQGKIRDFLSSSEIEVVPGIVTSAHIRKSAIQFLTVQYQDTSKTHETDQVILATGHLIGGGLKKTKACEEPLFHLPLFHQDRKVDEALITRLTGEKFSDPHAVFSVGVRTDRDLRPLNEKKEVVFQNLFVCGSLLANSENVERLCGMGVALLSGQRAGRLGESS